MTSIVAKFRRAAGRAWRNPGIVLTEARLRFWNFPVLARDPEAYQFVSSWAYGQAPRRPLTELFSGIEHVAVDVVNAFDRDIGTSVTAKEVLAIGAVVQWHQPKRIIEIGTFNGNTTLNLAVNAAPDAEVTTVDLPPDWNGQLGIAIPDDRVNVTDRGQIGRQFQGSPQQKQIRQVYGDSATIDWSELGGPFDLAFIDGCHEYEYVQRDTENAINNVVPGGLIVWHDYGNFAGVSRAVDEFADRLDVSAVQGTRLAVATVPNNG